MQRRVNQVSEQTKSCELCEGNGFILNGEKLDKHTGEYYQDLDYCPNCVNGSE